MFSRINSFASFSREKDALLSEHLAKGEQPIVACIGVLGKDRFPESANTAEDIHFFANRIYLREHRLRNDGEQTYVISPLDSRDKKSSQFFSCTGVFAVGKEKRTGENISFASHQCPIRVLKGFRHHSAFLKDMKRTLTEMKNRATEGTIDAIVMGGNYFPMQKEDVEQYFSSIEMLAVSVYSVFGFSPIAITGPKTVESCDSAYFDTKNRRLFILRPKVGDAASESYRIKEKEIQAEKWHKEYLKKTFRYQKIFDVF